MTLAILLSLTFSPRNGRTASNGSQPCAYFVVLGSSYSLAQLSETAASIAARLKNIEGVAGVSSIGDRPYALRIRVDFQRLEAYGLSLREVDEELARRNLARERFISSIRDLPAVEEIQSVVLKRTGSASIRLSDVAMVEVGLKEPDLSVVYKGRPSIALGIRMQPQANFLGIFIPLQLTLQEIRTQIPVGVELEISMPESISIHE